MTKSYRPFLFFVLAVFILSSCQKESSFGYDSNSRGYIRTLNDSNYLSRAYYLDTTATTSDTTGITSFYYDSTRRVVKQTEARTGVNDIYSVTIYSYPDDSNFPFQSVTTNPSVSTDSTVSFYFYDTQSRLLADSVLFFSPANAYTQVRAKIYTYNTGSFILDYFSNDSTADSLNYDFRDSITIDGSANVTYYDQFLAPPPFTLTETVKVNYDEMHNPFSRLSIFPVRDLLIGDVPSAIAHFPEVNNAIEYDYFFPAMGSIPATASRVNYMFTYNEYGYPVNGIGYAVPTSPADLGYKVQYEYRAF